MKLPVKGRNVDVTDSLFSHSERKLGKLAKPVTFPVALDTESQVSKLYNVDSMPSTVIVDRKGNVRFRHRGYKAGDEDLYLTQIRTMLKE